MDSEGVCPDRDWGTVLHVRVPGTPVHKSSVDRASALKVCKVSSDFLLSFAS